LKVTIQPAARRDILHDYHRYRMLGLPDIADRFLRSVEHAVEAASATPGAGALSRVSHPSLTGLRSWPLRGFTDFRLFYLFDPATLRVIRVLNGKRDLNAILRAAPDDGH
jgi:toxin ParE1/3/4